MAKIKHAQSGIVRFAKDSMTYLDNGRFESLLDVASRISRAVEGKPDHDTWDAEMVLCIALRSGLDDMQRRYCEHQKPH
jgi:hypothetical protein